MKKKTIRKKTTRKKKNPPPTPEDFVEHLRLSSEATTALAEKIRKSQKMMGPSKSVPHRHREPTQEQITALAAAIDAAAAATELCASLHPQGCPPNLQFLTAHLDEACMLLHEAQRYSWRRFKGEPPGTGRKKRY